MLGTAQFISVRTIAAGTHQTNSSTRAISSSCSYSSIHRHSSLKFRLQARKCSTLKSSVAINISCKIDNRGSGDGQDDRDDYVEATVLLSETIRHYRMLMYGFQEETKRHPSSQLVPYSLQAKDPRLLNSYLGPGFLRRFRSPTIFLKVSCDGDFVLPILVGEYTVEKIIESLHEDENEAWPNQFQLVRDLLGCLDYEVKMVRITERVVDTYFARIYFHKPGENDLLSVDARPSDAINVARRCMAPTFVNKRLVVTDAIRIVHGMSRTGTGKAGYDVSLDSAADGLDLVSEELYLVRNMRLAAREERYSDAASWRDKLRELREKHKSSFM